MPVWLTEHEYEVLRAACAKMLPSAEGIPGAEEAGVADYIDILLGAFTFDPPRIWAGGPTSGRAGGAPRFAHFHSLSALDELAWCYTELEAWNDAKNSWRTLLYITAEEIHVVTKKREQCVKNLFQFQWELRLIYERNR